MAEPNGVDPGRIPTAATTDADLGSGPTLPMAGSSTSRVSAHQRVGRFTLTGLLGAGGMGEVFAARDPELGRRVAIKLLHPELSARSDARLRREARAMARLSHPNLVTVHEVGEHDGQLFVAMELIDGQTLRSWANGKPWREIVRTYVAAGRGLAAAHGAGIVHRDFKPDNVLVGNDGRVAVGDFGIARTAEDAEGATGDDVQRSGERLTQAGALIGTPRYMAPEQLERRAADARSDQFAFCVSLWEALDEHPYGSAEAATLTLTPGHATARRAAMMPVRRLRGVPRRIRRVLARGLALDPAVRWPDMTPLLDELEAGLARRGRIAVPVALVAAGAVALAAVWSLRVPAVDPCASAAGDLAQVWRAGDVARLQAAFVATGRIDASDAAARVTELLDRRAAEWSAMRVGACRALARRDDALTALYARQRQCLDGKLHELDALVKRLTDKPAAEAVDRSIRIAADLAPIAECGNLGALRDQAIPRPPGTGDRIDQLSSALAAADVDAALSGADSATRIAGLERDARALGWEPLIARTAYVAGHDAYRRGDPAAAEAKLREAALVAARAHDDLLVGRASALAAEVLVDADRPREALELGHAAEVASARAGDPPDLRADVLGSLADANAALSKYDDADHQYAEAIDLLDKTHASPIDLAGFLNNWANLLLDRSEYARSLPLSNRAVELIRQFDGNHHPDLARALQSNGNLLVAVGNYAEAEQRLDEALAIKQAIFGPSDTTVALTVYSLGNVHQSMGDFDRANDCYLRAHAIFVARLGADHREALMARYGLATNLARQGKLRDAEAMLVDVLARREAAADPPRAKIADALDELAGVYGKLGDYPRAIAAGQRALAIREDVLGRDTGDASDSLARLAGLWADHGECGRARPAAERALEIDHKQRETDGESRALPLLALAICDAHGRRDAAIAGYRQVIELLATAAGARYERGRAELGLAELLWPADRAGARAQAKAAAADLAPLDQPATSWLGHHR